MTHPSDETADRETLVRVAQAFGLGRLTAVRAMGGTASRKWDVRCDQGRFAVRVRPAEMADREAIDFDHRVLCRLAATGFPVPEPRPALDGSTTLSLDGQVYEVLSWIEGEPFSADDRKAVAALGDFLARLHRMPADDLPRGKQRRLREDHPDLIEPYLAALRERADPGQALALEAIGRQLDLVRRQLDAGLYASLPQGLIHGDLHPGNVRFRRSRPAALYDFDYLNVAARVRDVSDAIIGFASTRPGPLEPDNIRSLTQPFQPEWQRCKLLLEGYQGPTRLEEREWVALPWLLRSRWLQMRLRGSRKVRDHEKAPFVLDRFFDVIHWLDREADEFFRQLTP